MFEQSFVAPGTNRRDRTIALALALQSAAVAGLILIRLAAIEPLGAVRHFAVVPSTAPLPEPAQPKRDPPPAPRTRLLDERIFTDLIHPNFTIPHLGSLTVSDAPTIASSNVSSEGDPAGVFSTIGIPALVIAKPLARAPEKPPHQPVLLTSKVSLSQLVYGPKPAYPKLALMARVEGTVRLQAIIGRTGRIENLHALSGPVLLVDAAMGAVREWRYRPLLLNGEPVEVITEIDVTFTLQR